MDGTNPNRPAGSTYTTPAKVLQYIDMIYSRWSQFDIGINLILTEIFDIINRTPIFSTCKMKGTEAISHKYKYAEFIDCVHVEFKGTSRLYAAIGCTNPQGISNMTEFQLAINQICASIITPIIPIIKSKLAIYYPNLKTESAAMTFNRYVDQYITNKIVPIIDIDNKRFVLIIKK